MMRVGFFGDGRWAYRALEKIENDSEILISFVVARHPAPDSKLQTYAEDRGLSFFTPVDVNDASFLNEIEEYDPDINVSVSYDQILGRDAINLASKGFINCHAGGLPFYRGRNVLNWALINGEDRFGVTVHHIDESIDTGNIVTQKFGVITPQDDYRSLLEKAVELCANSVLKALQDIQDDTVSSIPQSEIHPVGFYSSRRREGDEWIDWSWSSERIHNLIRAIAPPGPGARTLLDGEPVVILRSEKIPQAPEYIDRPGTVVGRQEGSVTVKTGDTTIRVTKVGDWEGEIANTGTPNFPIGTTFGINLRQEVSRLSGKVEELERRILNLESE
ncbi:methionyl-tRNA formyltransferase [Salinibacter altiplanensis]|uniref:methionyl-tRNA formyltransferase n=1 Tax=Salinibacter altiplanensis TaxID=1803181 RepID=UPI000C9F6D88|nr:methionyl-tRNA formyltransferase [Salinibacter altiplanensis]